MSSKEINDDLKVRYDAIFYYCMQNKILDVWIKYDDDMWFDILLARWEILLKDIGKVSATVREIKKKEILQFEYKIKNYIRLRIENGLELTEEMENFKTLKEINEIIHNEKKQNSLVINEYDSNIEQYNNERRVFIKKVIELSNKNKQLTKSNALLKRYKTGNLSDKEIQDIADSKRLKNGRINYTAIGRVLGVSKDTISKMIKDRNLNWLIDNPDSFTPQK